MKAQLLMWKAETVSVTEIGL